MSIKKYIFIMLMSTIICFMSSFFIMLSTDPYLMGLGGFILFYISLGLSFVGTFSILGFLIRSLFKNKEANFKIIIDSFRQSIWISFIIIFYLLLKGLDFYRTWIFILFVIFVLFLEYLFSSRRRIN